MIQRRFADGTPHAASLIEGMRDFGYTLSTAMADVIDNSITAGAGTVEILADTVSDEPWIAIADDGSGMSESELIEAMRPGSRNPLEARQGHDLGRFGLGLKSASFSQCRQLTVVTRKGGLTSVATWDLDEVSRTNRWEVILEDASPDIPGIDRLGAHGTIVIWRKLDRLAASYRYDGAKRSAEINLDLSRFGAAALITLCAAKEMNHGHR